MIWGANFKNRFSKFEKNAFLASKLDFSSAFLGKLQQKSVKKTILKNAFSIFGHKMSMGRVSTEIFGVPEFFIESLSKKIFEVGYPQIR